MNLAYIWLCCNDLYLISLMWQSGNLGSGLRRYIMILIIISIVVLYHRTLSAVADKTIFYYFLFMAIHIILQKQYSRTLCYLNFLIDRKPLCGIPSWSPDQGDTKWLIWSLFIMVILCLIIDPFLQWQVDEPLDALIISHAEAPISLGYQCDNNWKLTD